ncbi:DUF1835 domain-containing protein [Fictibacillus fluitans]|uniref:DUF1835 domain-containing protein n=1 Tax=Fictibacillus fluitans TaxID=3058422 RepID=A0ABT8I1D2_9BACL|nr:DUF1835 domain-containing protein [Fictibacillus sp. NE201]MDN4526844.1 DUF1835 domain-containing protein [Fictibacillus sp. NE201]
MNVHIVNGDTVGNKLTDLEGDIIIWREMYDLGPVDPDMNDRLLKKRAGFFEKKLGLPAELFLNTCRLQEQELRSIPADADITLWFEHDRYDQTMLLYLLKTLKELGLTSLYMVTADAYPGIEPFFGLGQLTASQLAALHKDRVIISETQLHEAELGWNAYASDDPRDLRHWLLHGECSLPYTKRALRRHLSYFPSESNGLNEVEEHIFQLMHEGISSFTELYQQVRAQRPDDGLSDLHFAAILDHLKPLLKLTEGELPRYDAEPEEAVLELTYDGIEVLMEREDRFDYAAGEWWLGGAAVQYGEWRWNGGKIINKRT